MIRVVEFPARAFRQAALFADETMDTETVQYFLYANRPLMVEPLMLVQQLPNCCLRVSSLGDNESLDVN